MTEPHPADAALRFLAMYSEAHQGMALALSRYLERVSPEVGRYLNGRQRRLSDSERVAAMTAIAADVGAADQWATTPGVLAALKQLRDTIGHSTLMGSTEYEDGEVRVYAMRDSGTVQFRTSDLMGAFFRAWWAFEQVLYLASVAGEMSVDGDPYKRHSGVSLLDAPPSPTPPIGPPADPVLIWERLPDDESEGGEDGDFHGLVGGTQ